MSGSGGSGENGDLEDSRIPLKFILMLSNADSFNSWGSIPAVDIALSMVNESGLLGDYLLTYSTPLDSQVRKSNSVFACFSCDAAIIPFSVLQSINEHTRTHA